MDRFWINTKKCLYQRVIVPTPLCGADAWCMRSAEIGKVNVLEMKYYECIKFGMKWYVE